MELKKRITRNYGEIIEIAREDKEASKDNINEHIDGKKNLIIILSI